VTGGLLVCFKGVVLVLLFSAVDCPCAFAVFVSETEDALVAERWAAAIIEGEREESRFVADSRDTWIHRRCFLERGPFFVLTSLFWLNGGLRSAWLLGTGSPQWRLGALLTLYNSSPVFTYSYPILRTDKDRE